jgi:hypothetical protein
LQAPVLRKAEQHLGWLAAVGDDDESQLGRTLGATDVLIQFSTPVCTGA